MWKASSENDPLRHLLDKAEGRWNKKEETVPITLTTDKVLTNCPSLDKSDILWLNRVALRSPKWQNLSP